MMMVFFSKHCVFVSINFSQRPAHAPEFFLFCELPVSC